MRESPFKSNFFRKKSKGQSPKEVQHAIVSSQEQQHLPSSPVKCYLIVFSTVQKGQFDIETVLNGEEDKNYTKWIKLRMFDIDEKLSYDKVQKLSRYKVPKQVYILELKEDKQIILDKIEKQNFQLSKSIASFFDASEYLWNKRTTKDDDQTILAKIRQKPEERSNENPMMTHS